jgi:hypothetical protein
LTLIGVKACSERCAQKLERMLAQEGDLALGGLARTREPDVEPPTERQVAPEDNARRRPHQQQPVVVCRQARRRRAVQPEARDQQVEDPALDEDDAVFETARESSSDPTICVMSSSGPSFGRRRARYVSAVGRAEGAEIRTSQMFWRKSEGEIVEDR